MAASVWGELAVSALLAPLKQADLRAPYCQRLECVDAAPGGHGRAWARFDADLIHEVCRLSDGPGAPTSLYSEYGIDLDKQGRCPLLRVRLPNPGHWCTVHKAGGYQHITLEEADATVWAAEAKLRRPAELFTRSPLGGDSAPCVGAFRRGRSRSRRLNGRCRRRAAIELAGGFGFFDFWIPTSANPADRPSRAHLGQRPHRDLDQPVPRAEVDLSSLPAGRLN